MTDPDLLKLLRCPETRQPLSLADDAMIRWLNERIAAGLIHNRAGAKVLRLCEGGLVREDGLYIYPIREDIPELLIAEAMPLGGADVPPGPRGASQTVAVI